MLAVQVHVAWVNAKNCSSFYGAYLCWTGADMSGATTKRFDESSSRAQAVDVQSIGTVFPAQMLSHILVCVSSKRQFSSIKEKKNVFVRPSQRESADTVRQPTTTLNTETGSTLASPYVIRTFDYTISTTTTPHVTYLIINYVTVYLPLCTEPLLLQSITSNCRSITSTIDSNALYGESKLFESFCQRSYGDMW